MCFQLLPTQLWGTPWDKDGVSMQHLQNYAMNSLRCFPTTKIQARTGRARCLKSSMGWMPPTCCGRLPHPLCWEATPSQFHLLLPKEPRSPRSPSFASHSTAASTEWEAAAWDTLAHTTTQPWKSGVPEAPGERTPCASRIPPPSVREAALQGTGDGKRGDFPWHRSGQWANPEKRIPGKAPGLRRCGKGSRAVPGTRWERARSPAQTRAAPAPPAMEAKRRSGGTPLSPWAVSEGLPKPPDSRPAPRSPLPPARPPGCPSQPPPWQRWHPTPCDTCAPGAGRRSRAERSGAEGQRAVSSPPSQRPGGAKAPALPSRPGTGDPPPRPTEPPRPVSPIPPRPLRGESSGAAAGGHSSTGCGVQGTGIEGAGAVLIQPQNATSVPCRDARFPDMQGCRTVPDSNAVSWTEITQEPLLSRDTLRGILPLGGLESVRGCPGRRWRQRPWSC